MVHATPGTHAVSTGHPSTASLQIKPSGHSPSHSQRRSSHVLRCARSDLSLHSSEDAHGSSVTHVLARSQEGPRNPLPSHTSPGRHSASQEHPKLMEKSSLSSPGQSGSGPGSRARSQIHRPAARHEQSNNRCQDGRAHSISPWLCNTGAAHEIHEKAHEDGLPVPKAHATVHGRRQFACGAGTRPGHPRRLPGVLRPLSITHWQLVLSGPPAHAASWRQNLDVRRALPASRYTDRLTVELPVSHIRVRAAEVKRRPFRDRMLGGLLGRAREERQHGEEEDGLCHDWRFYRGEAGESIEAFSAAIAEFHVSCVRAPAQRSSRRCGRGSTGLR